MDIYKKAEGLEYLICEMLRGEHVRHIKESELAEFVHRAGIAIHNIPMNIVANTQLTREQFNDINDLDPSGSNDKWGHWTEELAVSFGQTLPEKAKAHA